MFYQRHSDVWWTFFVFVLAYVTLENFFEAGLHKLQILFFVLRSKLWARVAAFRDDWQFILVSRVGQHKKRVWCFIIQILLSLLQLQILLRRLPNSLRRKLSTAFIWDTELLSDAALIVIANVERILEPTPHRVGLSLRSTVHGIGVERLTALGIFIW